MIFAPISGGHFNPAITLGVLIKEGSGFGNQSMLVRNIYWFLLIMISQFTGAILGLCLVYSTI